MPGSVACKSKLTESNRIVMELLPVTSEQTKQPGITGDGSFKAALTGESISVSWHAGFPSHSNFKQYLQQLQKNWGVKFRQLTFVALVLATMLRLLQCLKPAV